ncbi:putative multidrug resistance protein fnx1 [Cadophora sp. DSE1049]|nr:putative multidrug resistance protein fnx1 [Cadophora sp. DSE1049]
MDTKKLGSKLLYFTLSSLHRRVLTSRVVFAKTPILRVRTLSTFVSSTIPRSCINLTKLKTGVFVANAEGSLVLATYGRISSEFNDLKNASWLVTSYVLAVSAVQPIYGKLSDIFGRAHMLLVAYALFALGCAVGRSLQVVVLGRIISGAGGAGMGSLVSIIITDLVPQREVGSWRSYVNIVATTGRSLGGPIGGYLADTVGWRWSFLGQCPPTVLGMLLVWTMVPNTAFSKSAGSQNIKERLSRVDFMGALILVGTITTFLFPMELGGIAIPWTHPIIFTLLACFIVLSALFVVVETRVAKEPILSLSLLASWNVLLPNIVMFCQSAAQLGMMFTVPIFFEVMQDASAVLAGAHLFPAVVAVAVAGLLGGYVAKRTGRFKKLLMLATMSSSVSYLLLALRWNEDTTFWESLFVVPGGFGNGLVQSAAFVALTARIESDDMAMACSSFYMSANTGTVVGLASTNAVLQGTLRRGLEKRLVDYPDSTGIIDQALTNIEYIKELRDPVRRIVLDAYSQAFKYAHRFFAVSNLAFSIAAFLSGLLVREHKI